MKKIFLFVATFFAFCIFGGIAVEAKDYSTYDYITIEDGATYYESSEEFGSGRYAFVGSSNPYTPQPCIAYIDGYSFLDYKGNIITSYYSQSEKNIVIPDIPENCVKTFVHFKTNQYRNGWTDIGNVNVNEPISSSVEKLVEDIEDEVAESTADAKTAVVIDCSGSMSDNQKAVVNQLENINFNPHTKITVFANTAKEITTADLVDFENKYWDDAFGIGAGTNLEDALAFVVSDHSIKKVLLISDLEALLFEPDTFSATYISEFKIYDPGDSLEDTQNLKIFKASYPNADIERLKIE